MNYLKNRNYVCIDCHCHFSPEKAYPVIKKAMDKGLNVLAITEFASNSAKPKYKFQNILKNKNEIFPKNYAVFQTNEYSAAILRNNLDKIDKLTLFNSQEINTLDGHVVALFIDKFFEPGLPLVETAQMLVENNIPFILPHMYAFFQGVGEEKVLELYEKIPKTKFALEDNGQISWTFNNFFWKWNKKAHKLAEKLDLAIIGNSDAHLDLPLQTKTVANLYSAVFWPFIDRNHLKESFSELIANKKDEIKIGGKHRSTLGVWFWMGCGLKIGLREIYSKIKKK